MTLQSFRAFRLENGNPRPLDKGDEVIDFRGDRMYFVKSYGPRKVTVTSNRDDLDNYHYHREYYANVFNTGIWDDTMQMWTFEPSWTHNPKNPYSVDDSKTIKYVEYPTSYADRFNQTVSDYADADWVDSVGWGSLGETPNENNWDEWNESFDRFDRFWAKQTKR